MFVARYLKLIASVIVAAVLMMAVVVPMVYNQSMETTTIENEGAGWARFAYNPSGDYSESFTTDGSNITIGTQTGTASDMIVYATDVFSIVHADNSFHLIAPGGSSADLGASAGVASASGVITVTDSSDNTAYSTDAATWAYVPDAAGDFGFFTDSGATIKDYPVAAAGSFAGAYAYNSINSIGAASMVPTYSVDNEIFTAGDWEIPAPVTSLSVGDSEITGDANDWTFVVSGGSALAKLYSGTGSEITVPSSAVIDGVEYTTRIIGNGVNVVTPTDLTGDVTLKMPTSITKIYNKAFNGCDKIVGNTVISASIVYDEAFYGVGLSSVIFTKGVNLQNQAFAESDLENIVFCGNVAGNNTVFQNTSSLKEILNLGTTDVKTVFSLPDTVEIRDNIAAMGYIAPVEISEQTPREGVLYDVLALLPVMILVGVMMGVVALFLANRRA